MSAKKLIQPSWKTRLGRVLGPDTGAEESDFIRTPSVHLGYRLEARFIESKNLRYAIRVRRHHQSQVVTSFAHRMVLFGEGVPALSGIRRLREQLAYSEHLLNV